jgi:hypothetical protein
VGKEKIERKRGKMKGEEIRKICEEKEISERTYQIKF